MLHWRGKQHRKQQSPKPFIDLNWLIPLKFANLGLMYICEKVVIFFFLRLSISLESMLLMNLSWVEKKTNISGTWSKFCRQNLVQYDHRGFSFHLLTGGAIARTWQQHNIRFNICITFWHLQKLEFEADERVINEVLVCSRAHSCLISMCLMQRFQLGYV